MTVKELERRVEALEKRVTKLERRDKRKEAPVAEQPLTDNHAGSEHEIVNELLREAGLLAELTPEMEALADEWQALPEDEKRRTLDEFYNLKLDKPLSDIIIENRR